MIIDNDLKRDVTELIQWEATLLDRRRWDDWIDLYTEDAVYWVPSWANEEETTSDPETQLNLIYLRNRGGLEDRIFRIESRDSYASLPLDRTVHVVGNVLIEKIDGDVVNAVANCLIHSFGKHGGQTRASLYDFTLRRIDDGTLKIARKKITFIDDRLEGPIDVYHL
jgi:3-phenylpropionate/cinnamic acid dioxygenase small subunit